MSIHKLSLKRDPQTSLLHVRLHPPITHWTQSFLLWEAKHHSYVAENAIDPCIFPVLIDTNCSVACAGFENNLNGSPVPGDYGTIQATNAVWRVFKVSCLLHGTHGLWRRTVIGCQRNGALCSGHSAVTVLSQDCTWHHNQWADHVSMFGNQAWFAFHHENGDSKTPSIVHSSIHPISRLFCVLHGSTATFQPCSPLATSHLCAQHAESVGWWQCQSFCSTKTPAPWPPRTLSCLCGSHSEVVHMSGNRSHTKFCSCGSSEPPIMAGQLKCAKPMCSTCNLAKTKWQNAGAKPTEPNPTVVPS